MSNSGVHAVLPQAIVMVDKFHVRRMGNQAIDEFRRSFNRSRETGDVLRKKAAGAKKDAYLFRKRERDLTVQEHFFLDGWIKNIPELGEAWQPYILNYFGHRITNAFTESLNSVIRVMNRMGRSYSFEALRAKMLFSRGAHKTALRKPAFKRQNRFEDRFEAMVGYATMHRMAAEPETVNYGVDVGKLAALIESGGI